MHYAGWLGSPADHNIYLMWMRQAAEGAWLFENRMTTEAHRAILFLPLWLILGKLAGWLQLSPILIYHIAAVLVRLLLLLTVYHFASHFFLSPIRRKTALILVSLSSGLGWLFGLLALLSGEGRFVLMSIDLRAHEAITFRILHQNLHTTLAVTFMLGAMTGLWLVFKTKKWAYALAAALLSLAVAAIHPHLILSMALSLVIFWLFLAWKTQRFPLELLPFYGLAFLAPLPLLAYYLYLGTQEPVWRDTFALASLPAGQVTEYIYGYGLIWPLALLGSWAALARKRSGDLFMLAWLLAVGLLLLIPVSQPIRFLEGVHIPLVMLMTRGLFLSLIWLKSRSGLWSKYLSFFKLRTAVITFIVLITLPTNLALLANSLFIHGHLDDFPTYLSLDTVAAINWLAQHTRPAEPILASFITSNMLPGRSGNKVFAADWTHTLKADQKRSQIRWFFHDHEDNQARRTFLFKHGIRYVFYGPYEAGLGPFDLEQAPYLQPRYHNATVTIYEVVDDYSAGRKSD
jgi:hypothetical protein